MLPVSVVIPTRDRPAALVRTIRSLLASAAVPEEFVVIDASERGESADAVEALFAPPNAPRLILRRATTIGAAPQRNQGVAQAHGEFILFCDDDIVAEPDCVARLWQAITADDGLGGVSAAIVNQSYMRPGAATRAVLSVIGVARRRGLMPGASSDPPSIFCRGPPLRRLPRRSNGLISPVRFTAVYCCPIRRSIPSSTVIRWERM